MFRRRLSTTSADPVFCTASLIDANAIGKSNTNNWTAKNDYCPFNNGGSAWLPLGKCEIHH